MKNLYPKCDGTLLLRRTLTQPIRDKVQTNSNGCHTLQNMKGYLYCRPRPDQKVD